MKRIKECCFNLMDKLTNYPTLGCENTNIMDKLVSFLLVIAPLLQHYKGIEVNAGILVLILCLPYVCLKLLLRFRTLQWKNLLWVLPLVLFQIYRVVAHGTTFMELAHGVVLCGSFIAIALGGINMKYVVRSAYLVALAASLCIMLQTIVYYLFEVHLQMVVIEFLLEESSAWIELAKTGRVGITGAVSAFYRPSAFFLEPSHMFLYFIPSLCFLLLTPDMNWMKRISAVILSVGLILSTSGMGIVLVAGVWLVHLGFGKGKENLLRFKHLFSKRNIFKCIAFVLIFAVITISLPFLRYSILRIFMGSQAVNDLIASENKGEEEDPGENETIGGVDSDGGEGSMGGETTATLPGDPTGSEPTVTEPTVTEPTQEPTATDPTDGDSTGSEPTQDPTATDPTGSGSAGSEPTQDPTATDPTGGTGFEDSTGGEWPEFPYPPPFPILPPPPPGFSNNTGSTAITGRTKQAINLILTGMEGMQYVFGVSDSVDNINFNLPGFFSTMYKYGLIGTVLSYLFYLCCAIFGKGSYRWMAIIIIGISFFSAHTHGTFYMIFYVMMLMEGVVKRQKKPAAEPVECLEEAEPLAIEEPEETQE